MAKKERHIFLTIWLVLIIIGAVTMLLSLFGIGLRSFFRVDLPMWFIIPQTIFMALNLVGALALFIWKKWGFFAVCLAAAGHIVLNMIFTGAIGTSLIGGLLGPVILFIALQIGGKAKRAWPQLT